MRMKAAIVIAILITTATPAVAHPSWSEYREQHIVAGSDTDMIMQLQYLEAEWKKIDREWDRAHPEISHPIEAGAPIYGGWAIPWYIVDCESGGQNIENGSGSSASGYYQIIDSSWAGFGGYARAIYAPKSVQDAKAALMWAGGAGASHWAACL